MIIKYSKRLSSDLIWILLIMLFPLIGTLLYIILSNNMKRSKVLKNINENIENGQKYLIQDEFIKKEIDTKNLGQLKYISEFAGFPVTKNNEINYYSLGDDVYPVMLEELKKAKKFIFIEYFIINNGTMWQEILDILKEKNIIRAGYDWKTGWKEISKILLKNENGQLLITKETLDNMIKSVVYKFDNIENCTPRISIDEQNEISITLQVVVKDDVIIKSN